MGEVDAALRLSEVIDGTPAEVTDEVAELLPLVRRLQQLNAALPAMNPGLERRVALTMPVPRTETGRRSCWSVWRRRLGALVPGKPAGRIALTGVALAALLFVVLVIAGQEAVARFGGTVTLGPVQVRILPADVGVQMTQVRTTERPVASLAEAAGMAGRAVAAPARLPADYALDQVTVAYYDAAPGWWAPVLFVDQTYRPANGSWSAQPVMAVRPGLTLRQYFISLGEGRDLTGLDFIEAEVRHAEPVEVNGRPGVLMTVAGAGESTATVTRPLYVLIWQADDVVFELTASDLTADEMLMVARSVRPVGRPDG